MRTPFIQRDDVWQYLEWLNPAFCTPAEACLAGVMERGWVLEEVEGLGENGAPIVWEQLPTAGNFKMGRPRNGGVQRNATWVGHIVLAFNDIHQLAKDRACSQHICTGRRMLVLLA